MDKTRLPDTKIIDLFFEPFFFLRGCKRRIIDWVKPHFPRE